MKKYLLSFAALILYTIGAWALPHECTESTWTCSGFTQEKVLVINLPADGPKANLSEYLKTEGLDAIDHSQYDVVVINGKIKDNDLDALSQLTEKTIDLQDVTWQAESKVFSNQYCENLILPDNWTKAEVNAVGAAVATVNSNFGSCYSQGTNVTDLDGNACAAITAYVNKGNTLYTAMRHCYYDGKSNNKLAGQGINGYYYTVDKIHHLTVSGNPVARDYCGVGADSQTMTFDENGHFVFEPAKATEQLEDETNRILVGTQQKVPFVLNYLISLDLSDAVIEEEHNSDLTLSQIGMLGNKTYEVKIPTYGGLKTLPADFLNISGNQIYQICIPGTIENIETRAFKNCPLMHVWTTGTEETVKYNNGAVTGFDNDGNEVIVEDHLPLGEKPLYGSYTLPPNLKLIESHAFANTEPKVKDVYVLCIEAPECHVDAFNTNMYVANDAYDRSYFDDNNIISRDAYTNNKNNYTWMTMLHYPRECETPEIQRYTDPTRRYSVATGLRDGRGNIIYFPNQSEYVRAYSQGTYGYVWEAWDTERTWYGDNELVHSSGTSPIEGWSLGGQVLANDAYNNNEATNKTDRVFYDTTGGGQLTKPDGQAEYYDVLWEGVQLYPEGGETIRKPVNVYEVCTDGDYVEDYDWVQNDEGEYVVTITSNGFVSTNTPVEGVNDYYSDDQGQNPATPKVGAGFYYEDGTENVYTAVDKNTDAIGAESQYYKLENGAYVPSDLMFSNTYYYYTKEAQEVDVYQSANSLVQGVTTYYKLENGVYTQTQPTLATWFTWYYYNGSEYVRTTTLQQGVTTYYVSHNPGVYQEQTPQFAQDYYYIKKVSTNYIPCTSFVPNKQWYSYDQNNNNYSAITLSWYSHISGDYYYASGTVPVYTSAENEDYNAHMTYYSDQNGTVASSINFDTNYYYEDLTYTYNPYTEGATGTRYNKVYNGTYREYNAETDANEKRYCKGLDYVDYVMPKDYRGWHQFVLTGYATNSTEEFVPYRSWITDNDWWTICVPYDLTRAEMVKFFGNEKGTTADTKNPYLSRLLYVVRDVENGLISLYFSKNLLNYTYDEVTTNGVTVATESGTVSSDDEVVLHAGVPYMIRPNIDASAKRQFDIYKSINPELYEKILAAQAMDGDEQMQLVENGIYTVPAYMVNNTDEVNEPQGSEEVEITYPTGKTTTAKASTKYTYSFVGSFYNSLMPQYAYFLGWDNATKRATFFFNRVPDVQNWRWANETGIIMANWYSADGSNAINPATGLDDPARWVITVNADNNDDLATANANVDMVGMVFDNSGATGIVEIDSDDIQKMDGSYNVYTVSGQYLGNSMKGLAKGIYIVNGNKIVIK